MLIKLFLIVIGQKRFFTNLPENINLDKLQVIHQSINKKKKIFKKKKKIYHFVGKLNSSKGYDIFGKAIIKILNKYKDWSQLLLEMNLEKNFFLIIKI